MKLNPNLVAKQNLTNKDIALIRKLHKKKNKLFKMAKYYLKKHYMLRARDTGRLLEEIEFKMQDAWGFERNSDMHTHWVFNPACNCPKLDNIDKFYTGYREYSGTCIVHGVCTNTGD